MDLMQTLGIALGVAGFLFLITIHEGGHYFVSKLLGVRVNEFSVGMGPLLTQYEKGGTKYSFRLLPIGGYCALEGEFGDDMTDEEIENFVDEDPTAFVNQPAWKQILVLLAGSAVNMLAGFIIFVIVYSIVANGQVPFTRVLQVSFEQIIMMIKDIFSFLGGLFNGSSSVDDVSGVVGIVATVSDTAKMGLIYVLFLIGILSANLSVMNMLPIPGLDGGRILIVIIRLLSGGKLSQKAEKIVNALGMIFLFALIAFIAYKDVIKLIR